MPNRVSGTGNIQAAAGAGNLGCRLRRRLGAGFLVTSFSRIGESWRTVAAPVGDPLVLQVDRGRSGAGIVGADNFNASGRCGRGPSR